MKKNILCPECRGRKTKVDKEAAIFTLGMSLIFKFHKDDGRKICETCDGVGFLKNQLFK